MSGVVEKILSSSSPATRHAVNGAALVPIAGPFVSRKYLPLKDKAGLQPILPFHGPMSFLKKTIII